MPNLSDEQILQNWYQFASAQPGTVDSYLSVLREREGKSLTSQCDEFGVTPQQFNRLRSMRLPREKQFTSDAKRMADACQLSESMHFVNVMLLARNLIQTEQQSGLSTGYRAAFDEIDNLDELPDE